MLRIVVTIALAVSLYFSSSAQAANPKQFAIEGSICQAGSAIGQCVDVREFPECLSVLRKQVRSQDEQQFLRTHYCGTSSTKKTLACRPVQLNDPECGRQLTDRIIKGSIAAIDEYRWMALFQYSKPRGATGLHCGGVLINRRYVLSAAHCFIGLRRGWEAIKVRLGEWDTESSVDCTGDNEDRICAAKIQEFDLEKIIPHEGFSVRDKNKAHDIALVRLSRDAEYSDFVKPICLPAPGWVNSSRLYEGSLEASGWGRTENSTASRYKLYTKLKMVDYRKCKMDYAAKARTVLGEGQFCAGGESGQDTCQGDSGGPLMKEILNQGRHYVMGVVSFGPTPCGEKLPGVYTSVEHYYQWIVKKVIESSQ